MLRGVFAGAKIANLPGFVFEIPKSKSKDSTMPGRPRTPTALKLVTGTDARHPVAPDDFQPRGEATRPAWLKGAAARKWDEVAPELIAARVLTSVDGAMFAAWCALAAEFEHSKGKMIAARISQMRGLAASFGLEPSSRGRLRVPENGASKESAERSRAERHFKG